MGLCVHWFFLINLFIFWWLCVHDFIHIRVRMDLLNLLKRLDTLKEVEIYREWRSTCFDWLRGQPRACSMATAWGIAALWFFCFGWWKDYLQSPTIAQRLDTHTHTHSHVSRLLFFFFYTHTCRRACKTKKAHSMQHTDATTDMPLIAWLTWLSDGRPRVPLQTVDTATQQQHRVTPRNTQFP